MLAFGACHHHCNALRFELVPARVTSAASIAASRVKQGDPSVVRQSRAATAFSVRSSAYDPKRSLPTGAGGLISNFVLTVAQWHVQLHVMCVHYLNAANRRRHCDLAAAFAAACRQAPSRARIVL